MIGAAWTCLLAPAAAVLVITLSGTRIPRRAAGWIATGATSVSFVAALVVFAKLLGERPEQRLHLSTPYTWLGADDLHFGLTILVDPLSVFMMLIISGVGSLIVCYSIGYMDGEDEERRYFAYMALFVFSMLTLVQAGNLLILLVGWGLVGLSSYLLIGFNHERPSAVAAAKKAFIVNAVGDATFALALFLLILHTGRIGFGALNAIQGSSSLVINLVALGLLGGAVAKSAQIPLHTWLPDAMEGPTPVSALIHAATMVTAGVYLIARTHVVFELASHVQDLAAILGAITLLVAGLVALVQTDIKRVIAYSTMSQIGYMFVGVGVGAYSNGMFHLLTHAFFKAALFLAAGLVIHALSGEQDMRRMGGLRKLMPITWLFFLAGGLALVGIPPFAGFFSKDPILASTLARGTFGVFLWTAGIIGTFLTGVYTFRMLFLVFWGEPSAFVREHYHAHQGKEGPRTMFWPVAVLALLSIVGGWIQFVPFWTPVSNFLEVSAPPLVEATHTQEAVSSVFAVLFGLIGIGVAWSLYATRRAEVPRVPWAQSLLEHKFWFDEAYDVVFYRPAVWLAKALDRWFERPVILGSLTEIAAAARGSGKLASRAQSGLIRAYALALASGLAVLVVVFIAVKPPTVNGDVNEWLTTILIFLPVAGALVLFVVPLRAYAAASFALLVSLVEVGFWIEALTRFDFSRGLQFEQQGSWFSDLHVSYHVGLFGFSLWLVGLTTVVTTAAIGYAFIVGRERARAYYGLMLLLTGAIVGVFAAQDLILFYVMFEVMLIPLYVLVGVWGGAGRLGATFKFVAYTMAGSLLMLLAIIAFGLSQGTFDLVASGTSSSDWIFLGFAAAFAVKAPLFPFHGWLPDAYREASPEVSAVLSGVVSKAAAYGFLRIAIAKFPGPAHDFRTPLLVLAAVGLVYGSLLAFRAPDVRGVIAYSSLAQMGLITLGLFAFNDLGFDGAVLLMVSHGLVSATLFLLAGAIERRTATGEFLLLGGMARGRPALATLLMTTGVIALAVPGSSAFAGEFLILAGVFQQFWLYGVVGAAATVLAAMYMLRLISGVLHRDVGSAVSQAALDLRPAELAIVVPLVGALIALSVWPASISEHSFAGNKAAPAVSQNFAEAAP